MSIWRYDSKTPIMLPNVLARKAVRAAGIEDEQALRFAARAPHAAWLAVALLATWRLGRRAGGPMAALIATTAAALDPNLAAHASVATADLPYTTAILLALDAALGCMEAPSPGRGAWLGAAIGLAFVAKVTAFLLLPGLLPVAAMVPGERRRPFVRALVAGAAAAWLVIAGAFLFRGMGRPLRDIGLRSSTLSRAAAIAPGLRLPVPRDFVTAFDASKVTEESHPEWNVVILGQRHPDGVWYYFALLWVLKTPLALLVGTVIGVTRSARDAAPRASPAVPLVAWNLLLTLGYFSLIFRVQVGYRYALVAVPLALVLASPGLASLRSRRWATTAALALLGALAENLAYFGNPLSFTNALVQPKRRVFRLIADSNVDWGQNRERIHGWLAERRLGYTQLDPVHLLPGHDTIDLNAVAGVGLFDQHRFVRENLEPQGHLGHTYLLYDVPPGTFDEFLEKERTLTAAAAAAAFCPDELPWAREVAGGKVPFVVDRNPVGGERWVVCVDAPHGMQLATRVLEGGFDFGPLSADGACRTELIGRGQETWWRLEPGRHAFCAVTHPNRRPWLPYRLEARFMVLGRGASLSVRPPSPTPPPPAATSPRSSSPPRPPGG